MPINTRFARILGGISFAGTMAFVLGVLLTMVDITLRSFSTLTVPGIVDIMQLCVLAGAMLAIPNAFLRDQHVAIDMFVDKLPERIQLGLRAFAALLAIAFLSGVLWFSFDQAMNEGGDRSQTIGIPMIWYWTPFLIGIALSVLANIVLAVQLSRHGLPTRETE
jgi:TRAP-type C4-dicarboxylate transport system permease small subunit